MNSQVKYPKDRKKIPKQNTRANVCAIDDKADEQWCVILIL